MGQKRMIVISYGLCMRGYMGKMGHGSYRVYLQFATVYVIVCEYKHIYIDVCMYVCMYDYRAGPNSRCDYIWLVL